jgi:hypothetical protein
MAWWALELWLERAAAAGPPSPLPRPRPRAVKRRPHSVSSPLPACCQLTTGGLHGEGVGARVRKPGRDAQLPRPRVRAHARATGRPPSEMRRIQTFEIAEETYTIMWSLFVR